MNENYSVEKRAASAIKQAIDELIAAKPNDRSEKDRRYAITITEIEKVLAYYQYWIGRDASA